MKAPSTGHPFVLPSVILSEAQDLLLTVRTIVSSRESGFFVASLLKMTGPLSDSLLPSCRLASRKI